MFVRMLRIFLGSIIFGKFRIQLYNELRFCYPIHISYYLIPY